MPTPPTLSKADASRAAILKAAAKLFRAQGYAEVSMRAIAGEAEMKAGSVYYHFNSKEQIVTEILDTGISAVHDAVEQAFETSPPDETAADRLSRAIHAHLSALLSFSDFTSANVRIFSQVPPRVRAANLPVRQGYEALWDRVLTEMKQAGALRPEVEVPAFRLLLLGALNATLEWFDPARGGIEGLAGRYTEILLHGVLARKATRT